MNEDKGPVLSAYTTWVYNILQFINGVKSD